MNREGFNYRQCVCSFKHGQSTLDRCHWFDLHHQPEKLVTPSELLERERVHRFYSQLHTRWRCHVVPFNISPFMLTSWAHSDAYTGESIFTISSNFGLCDKSEWSPKSNGVFSINYYSTFIYYAILCSSEFVLFGKRLREPDCIEFDNLSHLEI